MKWRFAKKTRRTGHAAWRVSTLGPTAVVMVAISAALAAQTPPTPSGAAKAPAPLSNDQLGNLHMARKEYADAVDDYLRALRDGGMERAKLWNKIGIAYQQQLEFEQARKAYQRSFHLEKDFAEPWNNLGTCYFLAKKPKKSLKYYRQALKLNPASAAFHLNLATAYYSLKKIPLAVGEYRSALVLDPDILIENSRTGAVIQTRAADASFFFYLAKVFASLGRSEEAVHYLRRAMEEGFQDQRKIASDPDLQKISGLPAYVELMKNPPVPIKD